MLHLSSNLSRNQISHCDFYVQLLHVFILDKEMNTRVDTVVWYDRSMLEILWL